MRYRLKLSDILLSLFVEFCIVITLVAFGTVVLRPYISEEQSTMIGLLVILWLIGSLALILVGAGWKRNLDRASLVLIFLGGSLFLMAGLHGFFGINSPYVLFAVVAAAAITMVGHDFANSSLIEKIVIIKRNPEFDEESEQPIETNEPLGKLFG